MLRFLNLADTICQILDSFTVYYFFVSLIWYTVCSKLDRPDKHAVLLN
ncbi:Uncharacterised protein [Legionella pneumophila]|nr:Uncharacterised protein [Legionella pneumophila]CZH51157.1 Uncharacterised protein [Legionella pneumophila]